MSAKVGTPFDACMAVEFGRKGRLPVSTIVSAAASEELLDCFFVSSSAVAALLQSPLVTSNAGVADAAYCAVGNLASDNAENQAKLGAAGVCEGGFFA